MASCSSRIARLIDDSESFPYHETITDEKIIELGFKKEKYCPKQQDLCIAYYYAPPLTDNNLQYSLDFELGGRTSTVNLNLDRESLKKNYKGTVILLHGFRATKEFMLNSSLYFRFLGFNVIAPDLLDHGESGGRKKYGVKDSVYIESLINNLISEGVIEDKNIYILGSSMGAITAAYISISRTDICGIILQAPMAPFDEAVYNYARITHPLLSSIIPEKFIRQGAILALKKANIGLSETQVIPIISTSNIPVLLFSSPSDLIAPHEKYNKLKKTNISFVSVEGRNHPSMNAIGQPEHEAFIKWIENNKCN